LQVVVQLLLLLLLLHLREGDINADTTSNGTSGDLSALATLAACQQRLHSAL
jgi:hypothetical protein